MEMKNIYVEEKQSSFSFRYGKTGTDCKVYYFTQEELEARIKVAFKRAELALKLQGELENAGSN